MTRTYAARRLLEHGPLTTSEMVEITGWGKSTVHWIIFQLEAIGVVRRFNADGKSRICLA